MSIFNYTYPSVVFQGITFTAKRWGHFPTISFITGAVAGQEVVTTNGSNNIIVQIHTGVSTTAQVITAIAATSPSLNGLSAGDIVSMVNTTPGVVTAPATSSAMSGGVAVNMLGFYSDQNTTALMSSFQYFSFTVMMQEVLITNDDPSGSNQVIFSWDGLNNNGILDAGDALTFNTASKSGIYVKYANGAPAYRVVAGN